ncbi:MAG: pentapeptide repeat-containing protein [Chloroflexota bacterium]
MEASKHDIERQAIQTQYRDFYAIGSGLTLVIIGIWIGSLLFTDGYGTNLYTEGMGVLVTILVLDRINQWRERQNMKKRLIREAGSRSNELAIGAVEWLRAEDWLVGENSLLRGAHLWSALLDNANLSDANLEESYLRDASLRGVDLRGANIREANLRQVNLSGAQMGDADLQAVNLHNSNLTNAVLLRANLRNARLTYVDFSGANLKDAILEGADLSNAIFDERTVMPDAQRTGRDADGNLIFTVYWTPDIDMTRYTDSSHPDFWQP